MLYNFDKFSGRLRYNVSPTYNLPPLKPPMPTAEPPVIHYQKGVTFAKDVPQRKGYYGTVPSFLRQKMNLFQLPNRLPVHIKGGPVDRVLMALTVGVCAVGLAECFRVYYVLSYPPQENSE